MTKKKLFIVAGLPRAGTTFLYFQLQQHPDIFAPVRKETNYFSVAYDRGMEWYHKLFEGIQHDQLGMDVTPAYSLDPVSIERIKDYDPDIKVIMGIRKPSKLVCSFYDQVNSHSYQVEDFTDFMHHHDWKISGKIIPLPFSEGWIGQCIRQWQEAFGDQLLLYDFELLGKQPLVVLNTLEQFLGLDRHFTEETFENRVINAGKRKNARWFSYIMKNEKTIEAITNALPRSWVNGARNMSLRLSKKQEKARDRSEDPNLMMARERFAAEDQQVVDLFANSPFVLGSGQEFSATPAP